MIPFFHDLETFLKPYTRELTNSVHTLIVIFGHNKNDYYQIYKYILDPKKKRPLLHLQCLYTKWKRIKVSGRSAVPLFWLAVLSRNNNSSKIRFYQKPTQYHNNFYINLQRLVKTFLSETRSISCFFVAELKNIHALLFMLL